MHANDFLLKYFPPPRFFDVPWVGIDIAPFYVRFIEIERGGDMKVGKYKEEKLHEKFVISLEEENKEVKDILKKWKKEYGLEYVKVSLPEERAYLFDIEIESGTEQEMRNSIELTLEENVPLKGSEAIFDYRLVGERKETGLMRVAVTVLPLSVVDQYVSLFHECGLTPLSFLIEPQALSRSVIKRGDDNTYLVANINYKRTGVFVVSSGAVQFTSTLPIGALDFTQAIMKKCDVTEEEAEKMKETKGFARTEENGTLDEFVKTITSLKDEIEKVYIYWNKHKVEGGAHPIQKVILSGKDSLMIGIEEYLSQALRIPVESANVWSNLKKDREYIPTITRKEAMNFGIAIGLALPERE